MVVYRQLVKGRRGYLKRRTGLHGDHYVAWVDDNGRDDCTTSSDVEGVAPHGENGARSEGDVVVCGRYENRYEGCHEQNKYCEG